MKAVILAGGLGTRLLPYTTFLPKPMLPLGGKPILEHLIDWACKNGIKSVVLCVSYMERAIMDYFGDGEKFGMDITYASSDKPLGTAGQLRTAQELVDGSFVCMYGDSIYDIDLRKMMRHHKKTNAFITMGIYRHKTYMRYGIVKTTDTGRVTRWDEKPELTSDINIGCYIMEPGAFKLIPKDRRQGMDSVVSKAILHKKMVGSFVARGFTDIGDKQSYAKASEDYLRRLDC